MGLITEYREEQDAIRTVAGVFNTIVEVDKQLTADSALITSLRTKIKIDVSTDKFVTTDMKNLMDALNRTSTNISRKNSYKTELATLKGKVKAGNFKAEIQNQIDNL